jgi:hypothetical protein
MVYDGVPVHEHGSCGSGDVKVVVCKILDNFNFQGCHGSFLPPNEQKSCSLMYLHIFLHQTMPSEQSTVSLWVQSLQRVIESSAAW